MATIVNTKLGEHRGKPRVWLEGYKLLREGYSPGTKFDLELKDSQIVLRVKEEGKFTVSKRERNGRVTPIIDLNAQELATVFDGVEMLRVFIRQGAILISAHHQHERVVERVNRLTSKLEKGEPLSVCSLFHGGGVLDKAIHAGFKRSGIASSIAVAVEMDGSYLDSSLANNPELWDENSIAIESPIQAVNLNRGGVQVDLIIGGIPCTGASKSGRSKNKLEYAESHSDAGALFFNFLEFVKALNPAMVLIENVPEYQRTASMEVIRSVLSSLGYSLQERILDGNEFGVIECRKRLCVVALSHGIDGFDLEQVQPVRTKESCINDILEPVALDSQRWKSFDYLADKELRDKAAGKGFARQLLTGDEAFCGTVGKGYSKCRSTEPFIVHPEQSELSRLFTPVEHCRIKGIPDELIDGLSDTTAHEILGQSVVYPAFEALASSLGNSLWSWVGMTPLMIELVDDSQPTIGGDDFHWATALVDTNGTLTLSPTAKQLGMPIHVRDGQLAVYSRAGSKTSHGHGPCEYLPVKMSGDAIMVQSSLVH